MKFSCPSAIILNESPQEFSSLIENSVKNVEIYMKRISLKTGFHFLRKTILHFISFQLARQRSLWP